ncbi:DUF3631 domain-containing protein [Mycobacterium sp. smrl_JER01]|uniref:DUF3631 domain-containing protein n=1 Tax=Mycobacterium sp. smrl_JER01 TaxID=3402633 RepID=UPI003AC32018
MSADTIRSEFEQSSENLSSGTVPGSGNHDRTGTGTGSEVLNAVETFLARFVAYPSTHALVAHVLWIVHCWFIDAWESTPRIAFLSPEPGSGKSRALEVSEPLVPRPVHAVNTTPAYLFRKVSDEAGRPTILYDEIDTVFGPKAKDNEDIRGMLNAGHRKGATAGRCVMRGKVVETEELPAYCAVALAGLDDLPDTIMTRAVVVRMRRRAPNEQIEPWRLRVNGAEAEKLSNRLAEWSLSVADELTGDFWPDMPPEVVDRDADVWEALLAVANLAGGDWPRRAREAAVALVAASKQRAPSVGVLLLRDIRAAFAAADLDSLTTEQLLLNLNQMEESPWSSIRRGDPLDSRGLSQRLGKYGISSKLHVSERGIRGYTRTQFEDAWSRYLPPEPATSATAATGGAPDVADVADVADASGPTLELFPDRRKTPIPLVTGPGRCAECGCHIETQGHKPECQAGAA